MIRIIQFVNTTLSQQRRRAEGSLSSLFTFQTDILPSLSFLSIVTQDPFLWHGSVQENLDIEGHCSDELVWKALRSVGMDEVVTLLVSFVASFGP